MDKQDIYCYLSEKNVWHEITEHTAVYNMAEVSDVALPYPEADGKNLFVRDDKKRNYYLITVKGDKRVDLKEFRHSRIIFRVGQRFNGYHGADSRCGYAFGNPK